jgi:hypothetical protein
MTSSELVDRILSMRPFANGVIDSSPDEVYLCGSDAQKNILMSAPLLEGVCGLALIALQERYQFPASTITAATATSPVIYTTSLAHGLNTGDTAIVYGIVGLTGGNARGTVTKVDATSFSIAGTVGGAAWTSGGTVIHGLASAMHIRKMRKTASPYGWLNKKSLDEIEKDRSAFGASCEGGKVIRCYEIADSPIIVGVQGVPSTGMVTEVIYQRIPNASEALSATVNPIIPTQYDDMLLAATRYYILKDHDGELAYAMSGRYYAEYQNLLKLAKIARMTGNINYEISTTNLEF